MADPLPNPDSNGDSDVGPDRESPPGAPRWVKVFGVAFLALVLVIVIMMASGHGPGRHMPGMSGTGAGGETPLSSVMDQNVHPL